MLTFLFILSLIILFVFVIKYLYNVFSAASYADSEDYAPPTVDPYPTERSVDTYRAPVVAAVYVAPEPVYSDPTPTPRSIYSSSSSSSSSYDYGSSSSSSDSGGSFGGGDSGGGGASSDF